MSVVLRPGHARGVLGLGAAARRRRRRRGARRARGWPRRSSGRTTSSCDGPAYDGSDGPRKLGGLLVEHVPTRAPSWWASASTSTSRRRAAGGARDVGAPRGCGTSVASSCSSTSSTSCARYSSSRGSSAGGDAGRAGLSDAYRERCSTVGRQVRVLLPGGDVAAGTATGVDATGRLEVALDGRRSSARGGRRRRARALILSGRPVNGRPDRRPLGAAPASLRRCSHGVPEEAAGRRRDHRLRAAAALARPRRAGRRVPADARCRRLPARQVRQQHRAAGRSAIVMLLILVVWVLRPFVFWWSTQYVFTDHRIIVRTGVVARKGRDMPLSRVNDVSFEHSFVERFLNCGTLHVESAGTQGQLRIQSVPDVEAHPARHLPPARRGRRAPPPPVQRAGRLPAAVAPGSSRRTRRSRCRPQVRRVARARSSRSPAGFVTSTPAPPRATSARTGAGARRSRRAGARRAASMAARGGRARRRDPARGRAPALAGDGVRRRRRRGRLHRRGRRRTATARDAARPRSRSTARSPSTSPAASGRPRAGSPTGRSTSFGRQLVERGVVDPTDPLAARVGRRAEPGARPCCSPRSRSCSCTGGGVSSRRRSSAGSATPRRPATSRPATSPSASPTRWASPGSRAGWRSRARRARRAVRVALGRHRRRRGRAAHQDARRRDPLRRGATPRRLPRRACGSSPSTRPTRRSRGCASGSPRAWW